MRNVVVAVVGWRRVHGDRLGHGVGHFNGGDSGDFGAGVTGEHARDGQAIGVEHLGNGADEIILRLAAKHVHDLVAVLAEVGADGLHHCEPRIAGRNFGARRAAGGHRGGGGLEFAGKNAVGHALPRGKVVRHGAVESQQHGSAGGDNLRHVLIDSLQAGGKIGRIIWGRRQVVQFLVEDIV